MKKVTLLLATIVFVVASLSVGCKKEYPASMSAKINNTSKNFIFRSTVRGDVPGVGDGFMITGTTGVDINNGEYLTLFTRGASVGTYNLAVTLNNGKLQCEALYRPNGNGDTSLVYAAKTGTISITKVDEENKLVSGTYSFTLYNKILNTDVLTVTEGKFENLKYIKASLPTLDFNP